MRIVLLSRATCLGTLIALGSVVSAATSPPPAGDEEQAVKNYLRIKYDEFIRKYGLVTGLAYIDADLEPLAPDITSRFLPGIKFYRTKLANDAFEFYSVNLLVAVTPGSDGFDIRTCTDTFFAEPSGKFLQLFRRVRVSSAEDRKAVANAVGRLFASVTSGGSVQDLSAEAAGEGASRVYRSRILQDGRPWRDVTVTFDEQGWVSSVQLLRANATPN
jgi:hypothetical protein